jgi:outer membrane protein assembly factor BamB
MQSRRWFLLHASAAIAAEWPEFRGHGDSLSQTTKLPLTWSSTKNVAWTSATSGYGQSSPVVQGGRVFLTSIDGEEKETLYVSCLDLRSGRELWRRQFAATQRVKNSDMTSKGAPTPCVDRDRLYVFFESGDLIALDHDGGTVWSRKLTEEYGPFKGNHGVGSSPRLTSKGVTVLVAHGGPCYLLSVDRATGKNLWRTERETKTAWTTPCVMRRAGKEQIVVSVNGRLEAYDASDGSSRWFVDGLKGNLLSSATISGDVLVAGSSEKGHITAYQLPAKENEPARVLWKAENASSYFGSPLIHRDRVWLTAKVGVGRCLDLKTGRELWSGRLAGECWASPVGAGSRVYLFTVKGVTEVRNAEAPDEKLAENSLDDMERTYGVAVVDDGFVLRSGRKVVKVTS